MGLFVDILDRLTCCQCKEILNCPLTLDCGHSVCLDCVRKIGRKNRKGQRCCPKCGAKSVTRVNVKLLEVTAVVHVVTASLGKGRSVPEVSSESGIYSLGTSCSISSMPHPPYMSSTKELFRRMFFPTDGLESEAELSQHRSRFSDFSESEQLTEDGTSTRGSLSGAGGLCDPELPQHTALPSPRARILHLLKRMISDGTQRSVYKTSPYKEALLHILEPFTCPHCKEILRFPVTLDCGHTVCDDCAETIGSKYKEGKRCCCCPKCGAESVTNGTCFKVNETLSESVAVVRKHALFLWYGLRTPEARSVGDSDVGNIRSECSFFSIRSMFPPSDMAWKTELFEWLFLPTDGLESENELSERPSGSSDYNESEQRSEDGTSTRGSLSGSGELCDPELPQQTTRASVRARIRDLLAHLTSGGTQRSRYITRLYTEVNLHILEPFTCPHCDKTLSFPVTLDCGHSICHKCAEKISSKKKGQRRCRCPKCGAQSVTKDWWLKINWTLNRSIDVAFDYLSFFRMKLRLLEHCSAGASESGMGDSVSQCSVSSSWSMGTMDPPLDVLPKPELFDRMFFEPEGLESEDELWDCTENEQRYKNKASDRRALPHSVRSLSKRPHDPELSEEEEEEKKKKYNPSFQISHHDTKIRTPV